MNQNSSQEGQNSPAPQQTEKKRKPQSSKRIIWIVAGVVLLAGGYFYTASKRKGNTVEVLPVAVSVVRGDITSTVSSSGSVRPIEQYNIVSLVSGDIAQDSISAGSAVHKDQLLYVIESETAGTAIQRAEISLQQQELSYRQSLDNVGNLNVRMPIGGIITSLSVKEGDNVNNGARICDIVNNQELTVKLPFHEDDARSIYVGQAAVVYLEESGEFFYGYVSAIASGSIITAAGNIVSNVTVAFENPGAIVQNATATAIVGNFACSETGRVEYGRTETVFSKSSGTVTGLTKNIGDRVYANELLFTLDNQSLVISSQSSALSLQTARLNLNDSRTQLDNYNIRSPIDGTIIDKSYKAGDTLDSNRTVLAVVADMSRLTFTMNIDELDVKKLSVGQRVDVIADAMPAQVFEGRIDTIGIIGAGSSGVTYYPVEVVIESYEGLLPGMNVTADIVVDEKHGILRIPISAVSRGDVVLITKEYADSIGATYPQPRAEGEQVRSPDGQQQQGQSRPPEGQQQRQPPASGQQQSGAQSQSQGAGAPVTRTIGAPAGSLVDRPGNPTGYVWLKVETGMSDGTNIEITAGLREDAVVYILPSSIGTSSNNTGFFVNSAPARTTTTTQYGPGPGGGGTTIVTTGP